MTEAVVAPAFNDPSYDIFSEAIKDESTVETRWMEIKTDPVDLKSKNNANDFYDLEWRPQPEWANLSESYLDISLMVKRAGTEKRFDADRASICNNIGNLFNRCQLFIGNDEVEGPQNMGIADTMCKLIYVGNDWAQTAGTSEGWFLDSNATSQVAAAGADVAAYMASLATVNTGHAARYALYASGVANDANAEPIRLTYKLPLGFLQQRKYIRNLRVLIRLYRNDDRFFMYQTGANRNTAVIHTISWWVPTIRPNPVREAEILARLASGAARPFQFETMTAIRYATLSNSANFSQNMASFTAKPKTCIVGFQSRPVVEQIVNPAIFSPARLKQIYLTVNDKRYPYLNYMTSFINPKSFSRPYQELLRVAGKTTNYDGGCQITRANFETLYPLFVFDLKSGDSGLPELNKEQTRVDMTCEFDVTVTDPVSPGASTYDIIMVFIFDKYIEVYGQDNPVVKTIYGI